MSFYIKSLEIDLGTTEVENMFIHEFMPLANGTHVKVYILGYYYACNPNQLYSNDTIAKALKISLEDVCSAWEFWSSKGIVECESPSNPYHPHLFEIKFFSTREMYLKHNFVNKSNPSSNQSPRVSGNTPAHRVVSAMSNPELKKMFQQIEYVIKRPLSPANHQKILDWMTNFKMDPDMIERAFIITYEERPKLQDEPNIDRHFKYIESILTNWFDKRIFSSEALQEEQKSHQEKLSHYKSIYSAIGISNRTISAGDKEIVDNWSEKIDTETQLFIIKEATKRTTNPNFKYIDKIMQSIIQSNVTTIQAAASYFSDNEATAKNNATVRKSEVQQRTKRSTQNFTQSTISSLSSDELNVILQRKADRKKTTTEDK